MGRASRAKAERRRSKEATFEVFCPGVLEVLSIGKGDLKLTVDVGHPDDVAKARALIEEMLRKGYAIFVETEAGPVRVQQFNPELMSYVIYEVPEPSETYEAAKRAPRKPRKARKRHVPVAGSRATAVGRTAGGA